MMTFYRLSRVWHGYLSAFAFVWVLFFATSGILLNHPDWFGGGDVPIAERPVHLTPAELAAVKAHAEPGRALVAVVRARAGLNGEFSSGDLVGDELFVRLKGARGSSDLRVSLTSGVGSASVETAPALGVFKELHRGELSGPVWRALIDIAGAILAISSVLGLVIYFSLRYRLRTALGLIGAGTVVMLVAILIAVK
jgi:hypothetical protein